MAGRTPARKSGAISEGRLPSSPLGATPRPPLRQVYPKPPQGSFLSEYELNQSSGADYSTRVSRTTKSSYTVLRSDRNNLDAVDAPEPDSWGSTSSTKSFIILGLVFLLSLLALGVVYVNFPKLDNEEYQYIRLPRDLEAAKNLGRVLSRYVDKYYYQVLFGFFATYVFLQTFAIPGSIFLSIISGYLYPFFVALPVVCLCSALGASLCYQLFYMAGRPLVNKFFPDRVATWQQKVNRHRDHLTYYILFLRITPFLPNWFINITSPVINIPLSTFFFGTFFGVAPPSVFLIQSGKTLHQLTSYNQAWSWGNLGWLAVCAALSLLPILFKRRLRDKFD